MKNYKFVLMTLVFATIFILTVSSISVKSDPQWNVPDEIKLGDIVYMEMPTWVTLSPFSNGFLYPIYHVAMYTGNNTFVHIGGAGGTVNDTVQYKLFAKANWVDPHSIKFYNVTVPNPEEEMAIKNEVLEWIRAREGCQYQKWTPLNWSFETFSNHCDMDSIFPLRKIADINYTGFDPLNSRNKFYCAELIWAGYYQQDIDIDANWWQGFCGYGGGDNYPFAFVGVVDIPNSENTTRRYIEHKPYPPKKISGPGGYGNQNWGVKSSLDEEDNKAIPYVGFLPYVFKTIDINYDYVSMKVDWGDGTNSSWSDFQSDSEKFYFWHKYTELDHTYTVTVDCKDEEGYYCEEELIFTVNTTDWGPVRGIGTNSEDNTFNGSVGEEIQFNGTVVFGTPPFTWIWDFGDGAATSNGQNVTHTFEEAGIHIGRLSVQDANDMRDEIDIVTSITGMRLKATPNPQLKEEQLTFTAEVVDVEHENNTYFVFHIDGNNIGTSESSYPYTYEDSGVYVASVTVYDGYGGPVLGEDDVTVIIDPFIVDMGGPYSGIVNQDINFHGSVYGFQGNWQNAYWDFGDGSGESGFNVTRKYTQTITEEYKDYNATFTVYGLGRNGQESANDSCVVRIWNENTTPPVANVTGPSCGSPDQNLVFDGTYSTGTNLTYMWKVSGGDWQGGGSTFSTDFNPTDDAAPMEYVISLKVTDSQTGFSSVDTTSVIISKLKADFSIPCGVTDTCPVQFYDKSAPDGCSEVTSWKWYFGDGSTYSTSENPIHQYADDGYYRVKLTVGSGGKYDTVSKTVYVHNSPPNATSSVNLRVAAAGDNITFNSTSYDVDGEIVQSEWQFGDGARFSNNNTTYAYDFSGLYDVTLQTIDDDYGTNTAVKEDYLLIADTMVSNDFDENSTGWNATRFNDIQKAICNTPTGGLLVILDGEYEIKYNITIGGPINICGIKKGYDVGDTEIEYGGVEIIGGEDLIGLTVIAPQVQIKGITFNNFGTGSQIVHTKFFYPDCAYNLTDCTFLNCDYAANCTNTTNVTFYNCVFEDNDYGITLKNSDNITIQETEISCGIFGVFIDGSVDNTIADCNIDHIDGTAILIDNSTGNVISDCKIIEGHKGVEIVNVCPGGQGGISSANVLNEIQDTNFTDLDYGVYLYNSSHSRIGRKFWSFNGIESLYPLYYYNSADMGPGVPFPSTLGKATSVFASNDYPIYINHSHYNVVDSIAIASSEFQGAGNTTSSSQDTISIYESDNNAVISCFIEYANHSAINITESDDNTVCLCMLKKNQQGITADKCSNNMIIACSFFNNTDYGLEMKGDAEDNFVMYNDFIYNNQSGSGSGSEGGHQAYDGGTGNMWDDDGSSVWRDMASNNYELEPAESKVIGNFWYDYNNASLCENGNGLIPANSVMDDWILVGDTPYNISGPAKSQDNGPVLQSVWPESWYVGENPWVIDPIIPYLIPIWPWFLQ